MDKTRDAQSVRVFPRPEELLTSLRDAADEVRGQPGHDAEVFTDELRHRWSLYLDDDVFAGEQSCAMDLRD